MTRQQAQETLLDLALHIPSPVIGFVDHEAAQLVADAMQTLKGGRWLVNPYPGPGGKVFFYIAREGK